MNDRFASDKEVYVDTLIYSTDLQFTCSGVGVVKRFTARSTTCVDTLCVTIMTLAVGVDCKRG